MPSPVTILLVEDNPDDESLTERALRMGTTANIEFAHDGQEALDYLFNDANNMPRLVLLDLNLPELDGLKVLQRIRDDERTCLTPVVILTGFSAPIDVIAALSIRGQQLRPQAGRLRPVRRSDPSARLVLARGQRATATCPRPVTRGIRGYFGVPPVATVATVLSLPGLRFSERHTCMAAPLARCTFRLAPLYPACRDAGELQAPTLARFSRITSRSERWPTRLARARAGWRGRRLRPWPRRGRCRQRPAPRGASPCAGPGRPHRC